MNDGKMTEFEEMNLRIKMTRTIWFLATGMLGICIPLATKTHTGPLVPFAVLLATTLATKAIWGRNVREANFAASPLPVRAPVAAPSRVQELEERLANLEAITNFEHQLLDKKYSGAAPVSPMPVDSGEVETRRGVARRVAS
ncbi:MAG TPA: hypothetical protein VF627_06610 [Abditibacterium sp.]|jgi:hypothetical protein